MSMMMQDPSQGGPPPGLMQMIQQQGGPDAGGGGMFPPDTGGADETDQTGQGPVDLLRTAIAALQQYVTVEPDDIDVHAAMKVLAGLQAILAKDQKDMETATGVGPQERFLAKAGTGAPGGAGQ